MGLERLASVMQKRDTNFKIDIFLPLTKAISKEANVPYGRSKDSDSHMNAIADHIRAASFAIYDGARPSNEGRGFVIRKLIRKASQRARALGMYEPFLYKIVPIVAKMMKAQYPELTKAREDIAGVVLREEENLKEVLDTLLPRVEEDLASLKDSNKNIVPGALIFKYYDEKGLPFDLIEEKAKECSLALDRDGFDKLLEAQKTRSRGKSKVAGSIFFEKLSDVNLKTEFVCDQTSIKTKVLALIKDKEKIHVALDKTVFYGESGGQAGDRGEIVGPDLMIEIEAAKKYEDTIDHVGRIIKGKLNINDEVEARIDSTRRNNIKKNHTATHLLHSALKKVLGNHVRQYGSLVEADRLRFDFTHGSRLEERQIQEIEELVNANIQEDIRISTDTMSLEQAKGAGAIALFGEKYKGMVMVRTIGNISKELCGGTHVSHTGDIGAFKILNESSIASGVRRIEAVTSYAVYNWLKNDIRKTVKEVKVSLEGIKELSKGTDEPIEIIKRIEEYLSPALFKASSIENKSNEDFTKKDVDLWTGELKQEFARTIADISKEAKKIKKDKESKALIELKKEMDNFIKDAKSVNGVKVISREVSGADSGILRSLVDSLKNSAGSCIAMLGARHASRADMVCGVTKDLVAKGIDASKIIKKAAPFIEGSGGGRPDLAQAGGKSPEKLTEALEAVFKIVKEERGS